MRRPDPEITSQFGLVVVTLALAVVVWSNFWHPATIAAASVLTLAVPGMAVLNAAHPRLREIPILERSAWIVVTSLGASVAAGFVLDGLGSLNRNGWLCWIIVLVAASSVAVAVRRLSSRAPALSEGMSTAEPMSVPELPGYPRHRKRRRGYVLTTLTVGLVLAVVGAGLAIATAGAENHREEFVQLWLVPAARDGGSAELGIANQTGGPVTVHVDLSDAAMQSSRTWDVPLGTSGRWTTEVTRPAVSELEAEISWVSQSEVHRQFVTLVPAVAG